MLKNLLTKLILQNNNLSFDNFDGNHELNDYFKYLINGQYFKFVSLPFISQNILRDSKLLDATTNYTENENIDLFSYLDNIVDNIENNLQYLPSEIQQACQLLFAVFLLQCFVITNFSGPKLPFESTDNELGFIGMLSGKAVENNEFKTKLHTESISLLTIGGFVPYHLVDSPIFLVLSLRLFERLQNTNISLLDAKTRHLETTDIVERSLHSNNGSSDTYLGGTIYWWRCRALQVQQSLLPEVSSELTSLSLRLLSNKTVDTLIDKVNINSEHNQSILIAYHLEIANISIAGDLESQTLDSIISANKVSQLELVLTGCKAKMTKYQQKSTATLTVLARSHASLLRTEQAEKTFNPQDVKLNDDLFLEKPEYDSLGDDEILNADEVKEEDEFIKRIKLDYSNMNSFESSSKIESFSKKLLPVAMKETDIPEVLRDIDPNNQPNLVNMDYVQLLLRMQAILNNTPVGNSLVNEELIALIQRVLFSSENSANWLIFARALWYRSLLETTRSRTVERGVLQLYSLVEELGVSSENTARLFPKTDDEVDFPEEFRNSDTNPNKVLANSIRLKYIYYLPLMPKWEMDSKLAEKLLELGALKSALDIYERLQKWTDAALCYASTGDSSRGIELINKALDQDPNDARSLSVLGDIKNDPKLWEKAWEIGRYANAKRNLAKYYYNPPKDSGLERNVQKAIDNMYECLSANPINFDNWYFYGCMGLEIGNFELSAEAFTRCISLEETNSYAWSNLASALIKLNKLPEAFNALQKSVNSGDSAKKSWKIWENYMLVAVKLGKWNEVLYASVVLLNRKKELDQKEGSIDLPIMEKLAELLVSEPFNEDQRQSYFQKNCLDFICNMVPSVVLHDSRIWRIIAKVDLWRKKPWLALEDYEKAYRAVINNPDLITDETVWKLAVSTCEDLVSAYENFGDLEGRHGAGDVICKDWKFKAKSTIRSLISKGKSSWEYTAEYEQLQELKSQFTKK